MYEQCHCHTINCHLNYSHTNSDVTTGPCTKIMCRTNIGIKSKKVGHFLSRQAIYVQRNIVVRSRYHCCQRTQQ